MLAARYDSTWNLVYFCGCKDKFYVRRRLFEGFEQCVEGGGGQHVDFVQYINFKWTFRWRILAVFA